MKKITPFVKWVGGKTQLLEYLNILADNNSIERIVEPFVGGGAFFLSQQKKFLINDINKELITSYEVIQNNHEDLLCLLKKYEERHSENFYYKIRDDKIENLSSLEIAARFIYLNKAGFNGLYRVNSKGGFNVPFGKKEKLNTFSSLNIKRLSEFLNKENSMIENKDYKLIFSSFTKGDLYFVDPPYDKENVNSFTSYQEKQFLENEQIELSKEIIKLNNNKINLTN